VPSGFQEGLFLNCRRQSIKEVAAKHRFAAGSFEGHFLLPN